MRDGLVLNGTSAVIRISRVADMNAHRVENNDEKSKAPVSRKYLQLVRRLCTTYVTGKRISSRAVERELLEPQP